MKNLLNKEVRLSASILSFLFILFGVMAMLPGYPILVGAFFVSFGIFQSFQSGREANDIVYSILLPIAKRDIVRSKFIFCIFIELCSFVLSLVLTFVRMTALSESAVYLQNAMMNANLAYLGYILIIFAAFHFVFVREFFRTAYYYGKPFVLFIVAAFVIIVVAETLHFLPGLSGLNTTGLTPLVPQLVVLMIGIVLYVLLTVVSLNSSIRRFEEVDL